MQSQGLDWGRVISAMAEKWKESVLNELVFQLDQENIGKNGGKNKYDKWGSHFPASFYRRSYWYLLELLDWIMYVW